MDHKTYQSHALMVIGFTVQYADIVANADIGQ